MPSHLVRIRPTPSATAHKAIPGSPRHALPAGERPDGRQRWCEDAIQELLATEDTGVLFMAGCEENQVKFHPWFDHIILLSAPAEVLTRRLATRTNNPFGKSAGDYHRFLADLAEVEPRLRAIADCRNRHDNAAQRGSAGNSESGQCPAAHLTTMLDAKERRDQPNSYVLICRRPGGFQNCRGL
jgi:hypothetical protein